MQYIEQNSLADYTFFQKGYIVTAHYFGAVQESAVAAETFSSPQGLCTVSPMHCCKRQPHPANT